MSGITAVYSGESFADVIIILTVVLINAVLGMVQKYYGIAQIALRKQSFLRKQKRLICVATDKSHRHSNVVRCFGDAIKVYAAQTISKNLCRW